MLKMAGFSSVEEIHSGKKSLVYRANQSGTPVIIKILNREYPDISEINRFKHEFEILQSLNQPGIIRTIALEKYNNSMAIIFEDMGGEPVSEIFREKNGYGLPEFLDFSLKASKALGEIHKANIVHNDIKAWNIIMNRQTGELRIIDFGSATLLTQRNSFMPLNESLYGTLAHISPEQTGRMNRTVDYRTDFYSLGVTFYQLITGELPFTYTDPMEMVHAHIAKIPVSPYEKKKVPKIISNIIMKLLEKNPEDRYQTVAGLVSDLERCSQTLSSGGEEALDGLKFVPGETDRSTKFQLPKKLYGRSEEVKQIVHTFRKVAEGKTELMLISGRSGIGKSVLINEVNKPITEYKGYFSSGKYDLFKRSIPYRGITQAFQKLIQQILAESQDSIHTWKESFVKALGPNAKIIIDVIPELETLMGAQPDVAVLDVSESQNRFNLVFQNFIKACCTEEHPVAIFLDDLQWADPSSIHLIRRILSDSEMKYLFLMLSFRDNEVYPTDPFSVLLSDLEEAGHSYKKINLEPISVEDITQLVTDSLYCKESEAKELAEILHFKTKGNPFYVNEVFKSLHEKELIYYEDNRWNLKLTQIKEVNISGNVIDLIVEKIKELPSEKIEILKLAACIGSWFKQEVYASIAGKPLSEVKQDLIDLANEEFFLLSETEVNFVHDKIQEATYTLISEEERSKNHYHIGKAYLSMLDRYKLEDHVFTIVNQWNQGIANIRTEEEKNRLKELNILAGNKSMASTAYEAALGFFEIAIQFLGTNPWDNDYENTLKLYTNKARSEYLSKQYEAAEKSFDLIFSKAKDTLDQIQMYELKSSMYVSQNKMLEALGMLKTALKLLGVNLPKNPGELSPLPEIIKFKIKLGNRKIEKLAELPVSTDQKYFAIMRLLNACIAPSFLAQPPLFPVIVLKMVNLTLKNGLSPISTFAFTAFGMIQGFALGDFDAGYQFGKLGTSLIGPLDAKAFKCRTLFLFSCMINHWKFHAREGVSSFYESFQSGMETGDLQYASYSLNNIHFQGLLRRQNLTELLDSYEKYETSFVSLKQYNAYQLFQLNRQIALNFKGEVENLLLLEEPYFFESKVLPEWIESKNANALYDYYLSKSRLEYFFGTKEKAYEYSLLGEPFEAAMFGMMYIPEHVFFNSLISASLYADTNDSSKKKEYLKRLRKNQKRFHKWAESSPANYGHKYHIVEGLLFQIRGNYTQAVSEFKKAIQIAKEQEYILEEAIANELCASVWFALGDESYANFHLVESHYLFIKWGAEPKAKQLEKLHPHLKKYGRRGIFSESDLSHSSNTTKLSSGSSGNFLDLNTVIKASQTISGEIQLGKLLEKMLKILFENAGAERGFFILKEGDELFVQAEGDSNSQHLEVLQKKPLDFLGDLLSPHIVNYVIRTKSIIILNDAVNEGMFVNDFYIKNKRPKSILCYPILNQGNLVGAVYLENNLTTDAFTPDRIEVLKILSSQIAVSVENSILYANLEEKVNERTKDLNQALTEVSGLKEQQDGDYFLTSLLIEPLGQNHSSSKNVSVDFLVEQKKKFQFKQWKAEIGGDLCVAANLELRDRRYTVVLNGDAMGKSIQGAGGALVLGSVFEAILQRGKDTSETKSSFPERWLKNAFTELHNTFTTFDGSMLISVFLCLIDEETGFIYFINAEHPLPVLYRDGKSSFLPHTYFYAKLGLLMTKRKNLQINTFQLEKDDILIIGSDGRDDLFLGTFDGEDRINEDDELFLKSVEKGKGEIAPILDSIKTNGQLIDDLSLVRVEFKALEGVKHNQISKMAMVTFHDALTRFKNKEYHKTLEILEGLIASEPNCGNHASIVKLHINTYLHLRDYAQALHHTIRYSDSYPSDVDCLFIISRCFKKIGDIEQAIDYGERLRLRTPKHKKNLMQLASLYRLNGNPEIADKILKEIT
ncbi:protein kinase domain-containing protein [Leptospira idonii]|uniref:GAF domain-containing protein n=1 Tax=Leptospira idonii TaxID=1193500 RepID=A0A4R9M5S9_9LEPT|nr:AAA family ATPase [Leptospira idonii]TGN21047.1 GAF domain-containing protein [Leptospira idonii]